MGIQVRIENGQVDTYRGADIYEIRSDSGNLHIYKRSANRREPVLVATYPRGAWEGVWNMEEQG